MDQLPPPDRTADVRLWIDRSFTVRGLQTLGRDQTVVGAVARVAVNLRGVDRQHIGRGDTVCTPGAWLETTEIDVALRKPGELHRQLVLHAGSANVPVHVRPLGTAARLRSAARCRCESATSGWCAIPVSTGSPPESRCSTCVRVDQQWWSEQRHQLMTALETWSNIHDLAAGMPLETL